jgi:hypothetical protein
MVRFDYGPFCYRMKHPVASVNIRSCYICIPLLSIYSWTVEQIGIYTCTVHISSAEGYTNTTFCILCGINSEHSDIQNKRGYILKIITKLYVSRNDDITSFCYKSLITILVVMMMMMRRRRWTVMIWNILRMLLTI